jgi:hypothetical protein
MRFDRYSWVDVSAELGDETEALYLGSGGPFVWGITSIPDPWAIQRVFAGVLMGPM